MVTPDWVKQKTFYTTGIVPAGVASIVDPTRVLVVAGRGGAAGDGLVSPVLAHERPFICFPEPRAFDEQAAKAGRLAALGAAIVPARWPKAE